jgi:hypothetical protein
VEAAELVAALEALAEAGASAQGDAEVDRLGADAAAAGLGEEEAELAGVDAGERAGARRFDHRLDRRQLAGRWTNVPIGGRVERLVHLGALPTRIYLDAEYNLQSDGFFPEWTFRLAFVPLL